MFRPFGCPDRGGCTRRRVLVGIAVLACGVVAAVAWTAWQARQLDGVVTQLRANGDQLHSQLTSSDLDGAAATAARLRLTAEHGRDLTSGPHWAVAGWLPGIGRDVRAVRALTASTAEILDAAQPLESLLPRLDPRAQRQAGGRMDVDAIAGATAVLPALSRAVDGAAGRLRAIDPVPLHPSVGSAVRSMQSGLGEVQGPLHGAAGVVDIVPAMLGAHGPRTCVVLLEQGAEARGTGGLVGSFAVVRTNQGRLSLVLAQSRNVLDAGAQIPVTGLPEELRSLWGNDLQEWAGLNLSPHFPYTGQLVAAGWAAQGRTPAVDYVVGIDGNVVAALLAGTGPVEVGGIALTPANAAQVLSRDIYARVADPLRIDRMTTELVHQVFGRIATGQFSLAPIISAMAEPVRQRRMTVWAADPAIQATLETLTIGGAIPDTPGPFAMAVVNNGGGNKLDAYLTVNTDYDPGTCDQNVRLGHITVTLTSTAPRQGLPSYVTARSDLVERNMPNPVVGSNRLIVDVYGPVAATSPMVSLDDEDVPVTTGVDRNHPVWRVIVPIDPGQTRTLDVLVLDPLTGGDAGSQPDPMVLTQPMVIPATGNAPPRPASCPTD